VRRLRRLIQKRSLRWSEGVCVIEGPDLVQAALDARVEFEALYVDTHALDQPKVAALIDRASRQGVRVFSLVPGVLEKLADTQTPQPVLASVRIILSDLDQIPNGLILVLHEIRDPGNAGTIIRSADAAGASAVVFTGQTVDPFNPKTLRATAGSIFHLPVAVGTLETVLAHFSSRGNQTLATVVRGGLSHRDVDFTLPSVVVIGNEAEGLAPSDVAMCDRPISIAMSGRSESLNAGVAASLIAFEALRQRQDISPTAPGPSLEQT
jgi:TrmH family RNA methyltransferase